MSQQSVLSLVEDTRVETTCRGSESVSDGIRVGVTPVYEPDHSDPFERRFIFSYTIRITNERDEAVHLLTRRWVIINAHGDEHAVEGEGVVGRQPTLAPGESFEYQSYCPLTTAWGTMEGSYGLASGLDASAIEARIDRFYLVAPSDA